MENNGCVRFLTLDEISGKNKLDVLKRYGMLTKITDFALLLGCRSARLFAMPPDLPDSLWWTSSNESKNIVTINYNGYNGCSEPQLRSVGVRPVIPYSFIKKHSNSVLDKESNIHQIEFGYIPQDVADKLTSMKLEGLYKIKKLKLTGNHFTTDSVSFKREDIMFTPRKFEEYEFEGKRYIRFLSDSNCLNDVYSYYAKVFHNDKAIKKDKVYWLKVEPIIWLVDEEKDIALSKYIILSGLQFDYDFDYQKYNGDFSKTDIYKYLNEIFINEIIPQIKKYEVVSHEKNELLDNPVYQMLSNKQKYLEKNHVEAVKHALETNALLKEIVSKNHIKYDEIAIDENGNIKVRGLKI